MRLLKVLIVFSIIFAGFSLVVAPRIGFTKTEYIIEQDWGIDSSFSQDMILQANHSYKIQITYHDSDDYVAEVEGTVLIYVNSELMNVLSFSNIDQKDIDENSISVSDTELIWLYPDYNGELLITGQMIKGDNWSSIIYKDLPEDLDNQELLWAISTAIGIILVTIFVFAYLHFSPKHNEGLVIECKEQDEEGLANENLLATNYD